MRAVAAGDAVLSAPVTRQLLDQVARRLPAAVSQRPDELELLTEREQEVLRMLAHGLSNAEIAAALVVSEATVNRTSPTCSESSAYATACKPLSTHTRLA